MQAHPCGMWAPLVGDLGSRTHSRTLLELGVAGGSSSPVLLPYPSPLEGLCRKLGPSLPPPTPDPSSFMGISPPRKPLPGQSCPGVCPWKDPISYLHISNLSRSKSNQPAPPSAQKTYLSRSLQTSSQKMAALFFQFLRSKKPWRPP